MTYKNREEEGIVKIVSEFSFRVLEENLYGNGEEMVVNIEVEFRRG